MLLMLRHNICTSYMLIWQYNLDKVALISKADISKDGILKLYISNRKQFPRNYWHHPCELTEPKSF